jgi:hypothetical protein
MSRRVLRAAPASIALAGALVSTNVAVRGQSGAKNGETPDVVRNHPALKGLNIPRTGQAGNDVGALVTKTLLIAGEGTAGPTPSGQRGAMLRAYDKASGMEVGAIYMPAPQSGPPMTYMLNGRQHLVVAISGGAYSGELLAFRLPN